jgi:YesN/AraC family two-component response regulator
MGLRVLIDREDDLELVGEADDGRTALQLARRTHPDVLLLDIRMPGMDGLAALREITTDPTLADTRVVIVTTFEHGQAGRAGPCPTRGLRGPGGARPPEE